MISKPGVPISVEKLQEVKGQPERMYTVQEKNKIYQYPKESFQVEDNKVTYHFRTPEGQEEFLQYWLNRWKKDIYHLTLVQTQGTTVHTPQDVQYINYDTDEMFIYSPAQGKVVKIISKLDEVKEKDSKEN